MTVIRHAYLLVAVTAAALTLNWAAAGDWAHTILSLAIFLTAYLMAEHARL